MENLIYAGETQRQRFPPPSLKSAAPNLRDKDEATVVARNDTNQEAHHGAQRGIYYK